MSKYCSKCGLEVMDGDVFCSNCGARLANLNNESDSQSDAKEILVESSRDKKRTFEVKDYPKLGLIFSGIGLLCCRIFSVVGLIFSVFALIKIKNGEIDVTGVNSNRKLMAILGIAIGGLGLLGIATSGLECVISLIQD